MSNLATGERRPQAGTAFSEWQKALFKDAPRHLSEVVRMGNQLRALTSTHKGKRR